MINGVLARVLNLWLSAQAHRSLDVSRPHGALQVHAVGPDADRILLIIDRPSTAEGAVSQELGFAGHLARGLSLLSGRGTDLDIVSNGNMTAAECATALARFDLSRFDAVVLMLGSSEALALAPAHKWIAELTLLLDDIDDSTPRGPHTFVVGIPPVRAMIDFPRPFAALAGSSIRRLNAASIEVCADRERVSLLPFDLPAAARDGRNSSADFKVWAALIAPAIIPKLEARVGATYAGESVNEFARQLSLDELQVIDTYPNPRIDRLVESARNLFGATSAAVTFLDHDRRWVKSAVGADIAESPRVGSLCDLAIEQPGVFVVEDTHREPRVVRTPGQLGDVRFYAGFPLEAQTGRRVGVLCITDAKPRVFRAADSALLRELALQVQSELWSAG
jgi:GAF domain